MLVASSPSGPEACGSLLVARPVLSAWWVEQGLVPLVGRAVSRAVSWRVHSTVTGEGRVQAWGSAFIRDEGKCLGFHRFTLNCFLLALL